MKLFKEPFFLSSLQLPCNIFYAPMFGFTDAAFRKIASFFRPGCVFSEMVKVEAFQAPSSYLQKILYLEESVRPIGAQICGSNRLLVVEAAKRVEGMGFDLLDINCGCPSSRITQDGSGSGLLLDILELSQILKDVRKAISIPLTIKIRTGWDSQSICAEEVVKMADDYGVDAVTIHARTALQGYQGKANWEIIKKCKQKASRVKIIGNGDVTSPEEAYSLLSTTQCDGIMIGRKSLSCPWIVAQIRDFLTKKSYELVSVQTILETLIEHCKVIEQFEKDKALFKMKQVSFWYSKNFIGAKELRQKLQKAQTILEFFDQIEEFKRVIKIIC